MEMRFKNSRTIPLLICIILIMLCTLTGCKLFGYEDFYFDGDFKFVVNKNPFAFDTYNTLELIIDENEKIILYGYYEDEFDELYGEGEWIKDGKTIPVFFNDSSDYGVVHDDIEVIIDYRYIEDLSLIGTNKDPYEFQIARYVMKIHNDHTSPAIYRVVKQPVYKESDSYFSEVSQVVFDDKAIPVEYKTYVTEELDEAEFLTTSERNFLNVNETPLFCSSEIGLSFNAISGEGTWTVSDVSYPVTVDIVGDMSYIRVYYNTDDENAGVLIFKFTRRNTYDTEAVYEIDMMPDNIYPDTMKYFILEKQIDNSGSK